MASSVSSDSEIKEKIQGDGKPKRKEDITKKVIADTKPHVTAMTMEEFKSKLTYIQTVIATGISRFEKKRKRNHKFGIGIKLLALALSAIVTVILGLNLEPLVLSNRVALVISALTGVVSGISTFFDFNKLSLKYKDTVDKMEILKVRADYLELSLSNTSAESVNGLMDEYFVILDETYAYFQSVRLDDGKQSGTTTDD